MFIILNIQNIIYDFFLVIHIHTKLGKRVTQYKI